MEPYSTVWGIFSSPSTEYCCAFLSFSTILTTSEAQMVPSRLRFVRHKHDIFLNSQNSSTDEEYDVNYFWSVTEFDCMVIAIKVSIICFWELFNKWVNTRKWHSHSRGYWYCIAIAYCPLLAPRGIAYWLLLAPIGYCQLNPSPDYNIFPSCGPVQSKFHIR